MRIRSIVELREIEIKAQVPSRKALDEALKSANIVLSPPVTQRDQVFGLPGVDGGDHTNSAPWLRIRTETKAGTSRQIFTLKRSVTNQLDSIEHETEVHDGDEMIQIIAELGFTPYSDLTKTRQKAKKGVVEICVDSIENLGDFIEAEMLTGEDADYEAVVSDLWQLLETLGVSREHEETDGYDVMMRKKQGLQP